MPIHPPMIKLLGKASSINVRKVLWTLTETGLAHEREDWGSGFQSTATPAFLALNPNGLVPVLLDDGLVLWESNAICRYLAQRAGRHDLLPQDPRQRALVEQWMDWQATEFNNAWRYAFMAKVRQSPAHQDPALIAQSEDAWQRHIDILARQLDKTQAHVTGEAFTLADIVLGLSVQRWLSAPITRREDPAILAYRQRLLQRPGFVAHGANGQP